MLYWQFLLAYSCLQSNPIRSCLYSILQEAAYASKRNNKNPRKINIVAESKFSSYLDLTNVLLAGGAGNETALVAAADAGDGWAYDEVRRALIHARSARRSPWVELASLGRRFNLPEIIEVAGSVQLAGEHGARIRSSLAAKADSLRYRQMGEIEAQAQASTERMGIPMVMLFISFIALIGYPAVTTVVGGL